MSYQYINQDVSSTCECISVFVAPVLPKNLRLEGLIPGFGNTTSSKKCYRHIVVKAITSLSNPARGRVFGFLYQFVKFGELSSFDTF